MTKQGKSLLPARHVTPRAFPAKLGLTCIVFALCLPPQRTLRFFLQTVLFPQESRATTSPMNQTASAPPNARAAARRQAGFTLAEISVALAITGIAFVALLALIPPGMNNFRAAMDNQTATEIFQRVVADAQETDFDTLVPKDASQYGGAGGQFYRLPLRYFDDQGSELKVANPDAPTADESARIVYTVRVRGSKPGDANPAQHSDNYFTSLPGAGASRFNPRDLTFLSVQIVTTHGNRKITGMVNANTLLIDPAAAAKAGLALKTYPAVVARNGRQPLP